MANTMWVVVANASNARIFSKKTGNHHLSLIKEFNHPESRLKRRELISDTPGRYRARSDMSCGSFSWRTDPKKVEAEAFAIELADYLEQARKSNDYKKILLVMPAHFQGLLKEHISQPFLNKICGTLAKDYHAVKQRDLEDLLS